MKRSSYRALDYAFGQTMLTLRAAIGLTQTGLADYLGVSRRAIGDWEAGSSYPKPTHLKEFIALAVQQRAFVAGQEASAIRALWRAAHQKVLLDEVWLSALLTPQSDDAATASAATPIPMHPVDVEQRMRDKRSVVIDLPFQPTPFIGRSDELTEIAGILGDPFCRLLTLLGPGGIGKTRLGIEVAAQQADVFSDGVAFVPLAPISTPNQIISAIGDALHLSFAGQVDPLTHLLGYLRERQMLLVLDNFEHLLEGADLVYDILQRAPYITILVTSRVRLNLQAEWLFDVEGLSYPAGESYGSLALRNPADLTGYSAIQLFVQRAAQVQPEFHMTESTLAVMVPICQHLAGMPLAIELAAPGVRILPIAEIERQIRSNLDTLSTTFRDVPARHRSMRAVFDHSWNLLSESERALFCRLSVFRGGCMAEAAEQVAGASLPALMTLVGKSLLRQVNPQMRSLSDFAVQDSPDQARFVMLEPLREYALEKLIL